MDNKKQLKILIMKFRHIGDVLLTTPILTNLRHYFPDAIIDFALNKGCEAMIEGNPNIRKIHIYDRQKVQNSSFLKKIITELRYANTIKKENYDIAIQTTEGDRGIIIAKYAKIKRIVGYEGKNKILNRLITDIVPMSKNPKHMVETNLDSLRTIGIEPICKKVMLYSNKDPISHLQLPKTFAHMHLTSRWMFKCAKDELMAEIIDFCQDELKVKVVITSDKNEIELKKLDEVVNLCKTKPINLGGQINLKQVAALSKISALYIGVDTAIMHMAAANNTPCIALFGPSNAQIWGPWDNDICQNYLNHRGNQGIGKHFVFQKDWECISCQKAGCQDSRISRCLIEFSKEEILEIKDKIREKIDEYTIHRNTL
ncbi:putative lipopolysaccharide heptosyltransferase III [Campylobacter sp. RM16192]|uniref:putative lipopolysaccharide heptosyltransferase III n=1 Tax=Campylobacter sp. RM16192 TaxID=1660080 RepID=UPI0014525EF8|nr:putative lipopolysaccharide heptosyltransferase III [Campylobacter sp. RM16192]QCD53306.1 heptosyltransferase III [Campylobacter sp. RM16192]